MKHKRGHKQKEGREKRDTGMFRRLIQKRERVVKTTERGGALTNKRMSSWVGGREPSIICLFLFLKRIFIYSLSLSLSLLSVKFYERIPSQFIVLTFAQCHPKKFPYTTPRLYFMLIVFLDISVSTNIDLTRCGDLNIKII